ncbi:MAG TPA: flagellar hook-basal body complex protein [Humisphaera sp.]|jgi:flagellar hook protein FlgE|nr:flagellar hook-basal body complex protein [Humisphaera sp.]
MALTSTLFTGLSGLDVNQTRMNVVGNNIANVNTVAFKSSRALFKPQFYVTDAAGSAPSADFGGTNPSQRGLGAVVADIQKDFTPGAIEPTGRPTDMAIDGDGFFVVNGPDGQQFTRDGSFVLNSADQLVTSGGAFVQGFGVDGKGAVIPGQLGNINIPIGASTLAAQTKNASMEGNLDASGAVAAGSSVLLSQDVTSISAGTAPTSASLLTDLASTTSPATPIMNAGDTITLKGVVGSRTLQPQTFTVTPTSTVADLTTFYNQNLGIDSAAPVGAGIAPPGATMETDPADPTSSRFVVVGNVGTANALSLGSGSFVNQNGASPLNFGAGTNAAGISNNPSGESVHTSFVAYDSLGTPLTVDVTAVLESKANTGNTWRFFATSPDNKQTGSVIGDGTLTFDSNGNLKNVTGNALNINRANTGAASPMGVDVDFSSMTQLTDTGSTLVMARQDGSPVGTLSSFSIGADGTVSGAYTNGLTKNLAQVAMATFTNPQGLDDKGGNMFGASGDSGVALITAPLTLGAGAIRSGSLELSNVDISKEFTNLIIASTGFSASSKVISTSDQLIQELLNTTH